MRATPRMTALALACIAAIAFSVAATIDAPVRYEGDIEPDMAVPRWTGFRIQGGVEPDAAAEDGFAYELDARSSRMSWHVGEPYDGGLESLDNSVGWVVETRHLSLFNDKSSLSSNQPSDQNDTLFVFDGVIAVAVDFRKAEVRVQTDAAGGACSSRPLHCLFREVPEDEYVEVRLHAQGSEIEVFINDDGPFPLRAFNGSTAREVLIGSTVTGRSGGSLARWDYVRVHTNGPFINRAPTAEAGGTQTVECAGPSGSELTLNGLLSSDPDGDPLTFTWTDGSGAILAQGDASTAGTPTVTLPLGTHTVTLTVMDPLGLVSSDDVVLTVQDTTSPTISGVPGPLTLEATGPSGAEHALGLPDVEDACDPDPSIESNAPLVFPLGTTTVTFTAIDPAGNQSTETMTVTVVDSTPPTIESLTASPDALWPPNHKMRDVALTLEASDAVDPAPACAIVSVHSNESIDGPGDGNTSPDWTITGPLTLQLRAERSGNGSGRLYTVSVECADVAGNRAASDVGVSVPKSRERGTTP